MGLIFDKKKIQDVETEFKTVKLTPMITEFVNGIAPLLTEMLKITPNAAKGVFWLTLREWQLKTQKVHEDLLTMNQAEHDKELKVIFQILKDRFAKLLANPKEQQRLLDDTIDKVWNIAQEYSKKRNE